MERTLVILKPDTVSKNLVGAVLERFERSGLRIAAIKRVRLSRDQAKSFYRVHEGKPFYEKLADFISEGPVVAAVLEGKAAISRAREVMGATDPAVAAEGTIRRDFAESMNRNAVHGSDSPESAATEIPFFFQQTEII